MITSLRAARSCWLFPKLDAVGHTTKRVLSTEFDCSLFKRLDGSKIYPGPQANLRGRPFLPGSTSPTMPETLSGPRQDFPVIFQANENREISIEECSRACRAKLDAVLPLHHAVLFRGLPINSVDCFDTFFEHCGYGRMDYVGGFGVRNNLKNHIYNASLEGSDYDIELHNEMSYSPVYNAKIMFNCLVPTSPGSGGLTPICDNRDIVKEIDTGFLDKVRTKGIKYHRKAFNSEDPTVPSWQMSLHTTRKKEAENILKDRGMEWEWLEGDHLRFSHKLDAFILHPETGEELFFNHITGHHATYLSRRPEYQTIKENRDYPVHSTYGDGEEFEEEFLQQIRDAGWRHAVAFPWRQGDVIVLDNLIVQHSRLSYTGNRKLLLGLSEPITGRPYHGWRAKVDGCIFSSGLTKTD